MLVNGTPGSRRRLAVNDDGFVVRTRSEKHAKLWVRPTDLPDGTGVACEGIELVVLGVPDHLEDVDAAVTRCGGELLAIVVQLRVVDVAAVMGVDRLQRCGGHPPKSSVLTERTKHKRKARVPAAVLPHNKSRARGKESLTESRQQSLNVRPKPDCAHRGVTVCSQRVWCGGVR